MFYISEGANVRIALAASASIVAVLFIWMWARKRPSYKLPPGPPLDPLIGGLRTMPSEHQWETFAEWSKTWGGSAHIRFLRFQ